MTQRFAQTTYEAISGNRWRTVWLMMLFPAMVITITYLAGFGIAVTSTDTVDDAVVTSVDVFLTAAPFVTIGATIWVIIALLGGKNMVLSFSGAKPIKKRDAPELYRIVENLAIQTGVPTPKIYVIDDMSLNAFATGYAPSHAAVATTRGLLETLDHAELEAVMAHEMGHILHRDIRVMLIAITMVGIVQLMAELILRAVFRNLHMAGGRGRKNSGNAAGLLVIIAIVIWLISFVGAVFVQLGISRRREFMADAESAHLTRHPDALISALRKISRDARVEVLDGKRSIAAMCIADPLQNKQDFWDKLSGLFATHPPIEHRISALRSLGGS